LPNGHFGKDVNHEVGGNVRHAPTTARGAESPSLARESHQPIVATGVAVDAQEAMGEHAALEIGTNLALDEASDGSIRGSGAREKRLHILSDNAIEERLLGLVAFATNRGGFFGTELESTPLRNCYAACGVESRGSTPGTRNARFEPAPRV
jgi:hypothetical protein